MMNLSRFQFKREKIAIQKIFHQFEIYDFILQTVQLESVQATKKKKKKRTYVSLDANIKLNRKSETLR